MTEKLERNPILNPGRIAEGLEILTRFTRVSESKVRAVWEKSGMSQKKN